jgi:hypothetical protein
MPYKFLKITSYYRNFLNSFYESNPDIQKFSYSEYFKKIMSEKFAWSDFFKTHMEFFGNEANEIVHNAGLLQESWCKEFCGELKTDILFEQIKYLKPDVIFIQDIKSFTNEYLSYLKKSFPFIKLITGHICAPMSNLEMGNFKNYDFLFTCLPTFAEQLKKINVKSYIVAHAFETTLLENININNNFEENELLFIGSFVKSSDFHDERMHYIDSILKHGIDMKVYCNIQYDSLLTILLKQCAFISSKTINKIGLSKLNQKFNALKKSTSLTEMPRRFKFSKEFQSKIINKSYFGLDMYKLLSKAKIGFNIHGGIAGKFAANIRMFETTGVGSLLLTDNKENIKDFFEPDFEIITYSSTDECIEKISWLEKNPLKIAEISKAGQNRTLKDHTLKNRVQFIDEIIKQHLK